MGVMAGRTFLIWLTGLAASALLCPPAVGQEEATPLRVPVVRGIEMLNVGDRAPEFEVEMLGGGRYRLADDIGHKGVVMTFWSVFCETCREEMPLMQRLHEEYEEKGLRVLGINLDGAPMSEAITYFTEKENMDFLVLIDELKGDVFEIADPYGVAGTPTTYILDKAGDISLAEVGKVTYEDLESVVLNVLSPGGAVHRVRSGEYLMQLSVRYYGSHLHWRRIFEANKDQIQDPGLIYPGQVLQIPQD
jgi:peroxiredoxin